jgi:hypothetical protein
MVNYASSYCKCALDLMPAASAVLCLYRALNGPMTGSCEQETESSCCISGVELLFQVCPAVSGGLFWGSGNVAYWPSAVRKFSGPRPVW